MARVVVVGGGFGGMATAARLARLGHQVTLAEATDRLGGALAGEPPGGPGAAAGDFRWDTGPTSTALPAVLRDLFRKTGRPLEKELTLVPGAPREHRFPDGSTVSVPGGSRAAGLRAVDGLGPGLGREWAAYVDSLADDWDLLRRDYLERPWNPTAGSARAAALLRSRRHLDRRVRQGLTDARLRSLALHPFPAWGQDPRRVPAWMGVWPYLEQRFGDWTPVGGMVAVTDALESRLAVRGVLVLRSTPVRDLVVRAGRVAAVSTPDGAVDADVVVCAVDPRTLPALAAYAARSKPAPLPALTHLGLVVPGNAPASASPVPEVVLHGDPLVVARPGGRAPAGHLALTLLGHTDADLVEVAAARGLDLRDRIVARMDRSPEALLARWGQSPLGTRWQGRRTVRRRMGPTTPIPGVYAAGAHATPGAGLPFVGLSAALVAQAVGPA